MKNRAGVLFVLISAMLLGPHCSAFSAEQDLLLSERTAQIMPLSTGQLSLGNAASTQPISSTETAALQGQISRTDTPLEELIDQLVGEATDRSAHASAINTKEKHYQGGVKRAIAQVSDMAQFMTAYKGFQASSEAADIILEEKLKLKSRAAVDWVKQKEHDELHVKVVSTLMQLASGLGLHANERREKAVQSGMAQLKDLVGDEEANRTLATMTSWAESVKEANPSPTKQEPWDILEIESGTKSLVAASLTQDPVMLQARALLHKFNQRSTLMRATAKVVNTSLSIAMFSPTFVSPAAQIALIAFLMSTGGPEEAKLLKELYIDRRIESRCKMIGEEASLAINNYNVASMTGNTVLGQFCRTTAAKLSNKELVTQILSNDRSKLGAVNTQPGTSRAAHDSTGDTTAKAYRLNSENLEIKSSSNNDPAQTVGQGEKALQL